MGGGKGYKVVVSRGKLARIEKNFSILKFLKILPKKILRNIKVFIYFYTKFLKIVFFVNSEYFSLCSKSSP